MRNCLVTILILLATGCTRVDRDGAGKSARKTAPTFNREPYDHVLVFIIDDTLSMKGLMKPGGRGFELFNDVMATYFNGRSRNDHLIVARINGGRYQTVVWSGPPREFSKEFEGAADFSEFLDKQAFEPGSAVWDSLCQSLELVMTDDSLWNPTTKVVAIAITDMKCDLIHNYTARQRLEKDLTSWAAHGGGLGIYFAVEPFLSQWRKRLPQLGFKDFVVEDSTKRHPRLPSFE